MADKTVPSKTEAVREAWAELGFKAETAVVVARVKEAFGLDVSPKLVRNMKGGLVAKHNAGLRKAAGEAAPGAGPSPGAPTPAGIPSTSPPSLRLEDVRAVQELVARIGLAQVQALAALFAR